MKQIGILCLLLLLPFSSEADTISGIELLETCEQALNIFENRSSVETNDIKAGECAGYINGFNDGFQWGLALANRQLSTLNRKLYLPGYAFCLPKKVNMFQLIYVVTQYLKTNPKELHKSSYVILWKALLESFPCDNEKENQN